MELLQSAVAACSWLLDWPEMLGFCQSWHSSEQDRTDAFAMSRSIFQIRLAELSDAPW